MHFYSWSSPRITHTNQQSSVLLEAAAVQEAAAALCSAQTSLQWSAARLLLHWLLPPHSGMPVSVAIAAMTWVQGKSENLPAAHT